MTSPLDDLKALANPAKAEEMARYHKAARVCLGVSNPQIDTVVRNWQKDRSVLDCVPLARDLWYSDIHEARIAAAKLLTKARIRPDDTAVWEEFLRWVPDFDAWAIADHACGVGARRVLADPSRLDRIEVFTTDESMWVRRAALVTTLPWAKLAHPDGEDLKHRERILGWAAGYAGDSDWFIQKAVAWWLRTLSKKDPTRVTEFLTVHGDRMKPFARKEAGKYL